MNMAKFLRAPFLQDTSTGCFGMFHVHSIELEWFKITPFIRLSFLKSYTSYVQ